MRRFHTVALSLVLMSIFLPQSFGLAEEEGEPTPAGAAATVPAPAVTPPPPPEPEFPDDQEPVEDQPEPLVQVIKLGTDSLVEAFAGVLMASQEESAKPMVKDIRQAFEQTITLVSSFGSSGLGSPEDGFEKALYGGALYSTAHFLWKTLLSLSLLLLPLLIVANITKAYTSGVSAPVARAEIFESFLFSMGRVLMALASFWALLQALKIGWGLAELVFTAPGVGENAVVFLIEFAGESLQLAAIMQVIPGISLFAYAIFLFILIVILTLVAVLFLALHAFIVVILIWISSAPLVILLGGLPYFGWLYSTWIRMGASVIILPMINALLFRLASTLFGVIQQFFSPAPQANILAHMGQQVSSSLINLLLVLGFMGLLITVNFGFSRLVYGSIFELAEKAKEGVIKVAGLALNLGLAASTGGANAAALAAIRPGSPGGGGSSTSLAGPGPGIPDSSDSPVPRVPGGQGAGRPASYNRGDTTDSLVQAFGSRRGVFGALHAYNRKQRRSIERLAHGSRAGQEGHKSDMDPSSSPETGGDLKTFFKDQVPESGDLLSLSRASLGVVRNEYQRRELIDHLQQAGIPVDRHLASMTRVYMGTNNPVIERSEGGGESLLGFEQSLGTLKEDAMKIENQAVRGLISTAIARVESDSPPPNVARLRSAFDQFIRGGE